MERMIVVVFDNETKAYEALGALNHLDAEGSIAIHAESVINKQPNGAVSVKQADGDFPIRTVAGTAIGSLIGLLGGPVGVAVGAGTGAMAGGFGDLYFAGVDADFLDEVSTMLTPGKYAVVADISEEWITPVDTRMEALNGVVFRTTRSAFEYEQSARDQAALRAEIGQMKAEHARASADRKAKIQSKIDQLNAKLQKKLDQAKQRSEEMKRETEAKVEALKKKAGKSQGDIKASMEKRMHEIREQYDQALARVKGTAA